MCGIVGYIGHEEALPLLLSSLQRVTYRGYDSFGVAVANGQGIQLHRAIGTVEEHIRSIPSLKGTIGIGHTRWATVGKVCQANAHPHTDCSSDIVVVHNGDIENYRELKAELQARGHQFRSETDSEVIAHLVEANLNGSLVQATLDTIEKLDGSYAIVLAHKDFRELVVARRSSPLVVGLGDGCYYAASDIPAILSYTNKFLFLEDGDVARLSDEGVQVWHDGKKAYRQPHLVHWGVEELGKNGHKHFMLKEILEQPRGVRDTLAPYLKASGTGSRVECLDIPTDVSSLLLLGCGTSFHAAMYGERLASEYAGLPARSVVASEFDDAIHVSPGALAIALSQSGETADTLAALRRLRKRSDGCRTMAITNVLGSSITREVDSVFHLSVGPEVAVASTKTFLGQLVALALVNMSLLSTKGHSDESLLQELRSLPLKIEALLTRARDVEAVAREIAGSEHIYLIAKGIEIMAAMEGALKFKEVAYIHTEACLAGELKHGPFALLGPETPAIALVAGSKHRARMLNTIREIRSRESPVVAIAERGDAETASCVDQVLWIPRAHPTMQPLLETVVLQLLSYYSALERGCPIDRPRNLAKSVTVQ